MSITIKRLHDLEWWTDMVGRKAVIGKGKDEIFVTETRKYGTKYVWNWLDFAQSKGSYELTQAEIAIALLTHGAPNWRNR